MTVQIDLADGTTAKPVCKANDGTTSETNNLNLGGGKAKKDQGIVLPLCAVRGASAEVTCWVSLTKN